MPQDIKEQINEIIQEIARNYQIEKKYLDWAKQFTKITLCEDLFMKDTKCFENLLQILFNEKEEQDIWYNRLFYIAGIMVKEIHQYGKFTINQKCEKYIDEFLMIIPKIVSEKKSQYKKTIKEYKKLQTLLNQFQENQYYLYIDEIAKLDLNEEAINFMLEYFIDYNAKCTKKLLDENMCNQLSETQKIEQLLKQYGFFNFYPYQLDDIMKTKSIDQIKWVVKLLSILPMNIRSFLPILEVIQSSHSILEKMIQNITKYKLALQWNDEYTEMLQPKGEKKAIEFLKNIHLLEKEAIPVSKILKYHPNSLLKENNTLKQILSLYKQYHIDLAHHAQIKGELNRSILDDISIFSTIDTWIELYGSIKPYSISLIFSQDKTLEDRLWISKRLLDITFKNQIELEKQINFEIQEQLKVLIPKKEKEKQLAIIINPKIQNHNLIHAFDQKYASKNHLMYYFEEENLTISRIKVLRYLSTNIQQPIEEHIINSLYSSCIYNSYLEPFEKDNIKQEIENFLTQNNIKIKKYPK